MTDAKMWYVVMAGKKEGPFGKEDIINMLERGELDGDDLVCAKGMRDWDPLRTVEEFADLFDTGEFYDDSVPEYSETVERESTDVNFEIYGEEMQFVEIELDPGESVIAEAGAMMYMEDDIQMDAIFGDGSIKESRQTIFGKLVNAGKRVLTGESLFITIFTNKGNEKEHVAFASPFSGRIVPIDLMEFEGEVICQKDSFLCAAKGVAVDLKLRFNLATGLFGGEGFIMQKLQGDGIAFIHAGGTVVRKDLKPSEVLMVDTGCLVGFTNQVKYEVTFIKGIKSMLFGGEGLFLVELQGPGTVWLQSMPFSRMLSRLREGMRQKREEGSTLGGLGDDLRGDKNSW